MPRRRRRRRPSLARRLLPFLLLAMLVCGVFLLLRKCTNAPADDADNTVSQETEAAEAVHVVSTASITSTGDILMHKPVFGSGRLDDGSYQFESIFRYITDYTSAADLAVANLETTLCGTENGYPYNGYPAFNCPDAIVDGLKDAGFDLLLTANNHSYDTGSVGYARTVETVRSRGLNALGTMLDADEPKYIIKNVNGIRVGMICYTYETPDDYPDIPSLNGNLMAEDGKEIINCFMPEDPEPFYEEIGQYLTDMREHGAEATIVYIHWGEEYQDTPNAQQTAIAQQLCDLGVDVIIGGHPHVVQPTDLLSSREDPDHKTVILYSMGNAVSNQRVSEMDLKTGQTEDGVLFTVTFAKYSDGNVYLEDVQLMPCWVDLKNATFPVQYNILPLDNRTRGEWKTRYNLTDAALKNAEDSYNRTMATVSRGLMKVQEYLTDAKEQRYN